MGWACRLPGANSVEELWSLLLDGKCAISRVPEDRFATNLFVHPRRQERGRSITFAAGIIDDIWGFDPSVFGIAPREAVQLDPQQRILLQLTWEALENAGIPPSTIAGTDVGVFIGASVFEYSTILHGDPSVADSHFATGNSASILSNRISYTFNLHGPSFTLDTACSSSLVAMHQALEALRSGRIDTAIVGGINIIASPFTFITFSQASMLSPTGLCRAFSAEADGFVRAEGGAVLILRKSALANAARNPCHATVLASDVNSDGRTVGISLPSVAAQQSLLERVYARANINPQRLAFVEAHGTGTPVGDPIEAMAIGEGLGRKRTKPLPIGSIKTNIGHLEAASGMAGMLKAMLSLQHGVLPKSLHFDKPSENIDFESLNLRVSDQPILLQSDTEQCAGVSSFGFGGTNAHVILAPGRRAKADQQPGMANGHAVFSISASSKEALGALARTYTQQIQGMPETEVEKLAGAVAHRRDQLPHRAVVSTLNKPDVLSALDALSKDTTNINLTTGVASGTDLPVAFVYSGNGSQWHGMGRVAYRVNKVFREHFDHIDSLFAPLAGWSLKAALIDDGWEERLQLTHVAQPLIFAIQSASTVALRNRGLVPAAVLGHSVGEVAAAEAAGILDLNAAVRVIFYRSKHQETVRGSGNMAALLASPQEAAELIRSHEGVEIAAFNSPKAVTLAGPASSLERLQRTAKKQRIAYLDLDLPYPFHTSAMQPIRNGLLQDLSDLKGHDSETPFVSAVTGTCIPGERLNSHYWWDNIREPVRFSDAVQEAFRIGARCFVEIGPRGMLLKHVHDTLEDQGIRFTTINVLEREESSPEPFARAVARALVHGAKIDKAAVSPNDPGPAIPLPSYPWRQEPFRLETTPELHGLLKTGDHPFQIFRTTGDGLEWHCFVDTDSMPWLADHRISDQVIFPGAGFLELALFVAGQYLKTDKVCISHFEILRPLDLSGGKTREIMTRISPGSLTFEILSRTRLSASAWQLHCRGKIGHGVPAPKAAATSGRSRAVNISHEKIYDLWDSNGMHYGPAFRHAQTMRNFKDREIHVELKPSNTATQFLLDPMRLDACFHAMVVLFPELNTLERGMTYIPARLEKATLHAARGKPAGATIRIHSKNDRSILMDLVVHDHEGHPLAALTGLRAQAIQIRRLNHFDSLALIERCRPLAGHLAGSSGIHLKPSDIVAEAFATGAIQQQPQSSEAHLLLEGWATVMAHRIVSAIPAGRSIDLEQLAISSRIDPQSVSWLFTLLRRLASVGLAEHDGHKWIINRDEVLPDPAALVSELAEKHPQLASKILIAGEVTGRVEKFLNAQTVSAEGILSAATREFHRISNITLKSAIETLAARVRFVLEMQKGHRTLRVLQVGHNALTLRLVELFRKFSVSYTIFEPEESALEEARIDLEFHREIELIGRNDPLKPESCDLIVSAYGLWMADDEPLLQSLRNALADNGVLMAIEPQPALIHDLLAGTEIAVRKDSRDSGTGILRGERSWTEALRAAKFAEVSVHSMNCVTGCSLLLVAGKPAAGDAQKNHIPATDFPKIDAVILSTESDSPFSTQLRRELEGRNRPVSALTRSGGFSEAAGQGGSVFISAAAKGASSTTHMLSARCMSLKYALEQIGSSKIPVWIVFNGALPDASGNVDPVEAGAWAFVRVAANEFNNLDLRRVDVSSTITPQEAAAHLCALMASGTEETEIRIGKNGLQAMRIEYADQLRGGEVSATARAQLQKQPHAAHRVAWMPLARVAPKSSEVEVKVAATGLNFRDLMWSIGLLPDDILEDGYTGPTLGLECAGEVIRVGEAVTALKPGDRVVAFAPSAFSTHVTLAASQALKIPASMSFEAAATIPVAFLTAYYGLINLAKLRRGNWVLIHAAAGGVGMAAIQIANACGARVIATAGSEAKRSMLRAMGVEHVLDSRSNAFVNEVRGITGAGVDVVLNSLAGEAMELSIECLRPFGRFIELGKRDYVGNTHIGLRPFRKNLSYFGVDVDQLLLKNRQSAARLFRIMMAQFEQGAFKPLPHSVFPAEDIGHALQLMQKSQHIGKIVVTPPPVQNVKALPTPFAVNHKGTHVITGGFGGFGLETAKWLVERGAKSLILIGRSGAANDEARETLARFKKRGVRVLEAMVDVSDVKAMEILFAKIGGTMPPVCGIIHAAMVLDDGLIANLNAERFNRVLAPKVEGAKNLDRLTRGLPLEYFVMFSSVTTLIGNPGQGNYVAANAFMEAIARQRRAMGLPALAIGWGPITDVGVIARNRKLQASLSSLRRVRGMESREALDLMASAIEQSRLLPGLSAVTIAPYDNSMTGNRLKVLRSPTYRVFLQASAEHHEGIPEIDLPMLLQTEKIEVVRAKVSDIIVTQIAKVLRFKESDIARNRPLGELGLDSLMAMELFLKLEAAFQISAPVTGSAGDLTVMKLADEIIAQASSGEPADEADSAAHAVLAKHVTTIGKRPVTLAQGDDREQQRLIK